MSTTNQQVEVELSVDIEMPAGPGVWKHGSIMYISVEISEVDASFDTPSGTEPRTEHNITILEGRLILTDKDGGDVDELFMSPQHILKHVKFDEIAVEAYRAAGLY